MPRSEKSGLDDCVELMATMWTSEVAGHTHERQARHAAAMLLSGSGITGTDATAEMIELLDEAIQVGYIAALKEVENGDLDDDIRSWRPDLADE
ncbi:hypothetical protein LO762_21540 [Actinocorallia sp. API 0066]|uniref:hypothetical protein n=1 Tax=Actinocorallia sp. API 0066 TaxID=2896846 RepID=UPI001E2D8BDB|nr:hypothetical protein [Actinocorallia sp. API 0066]MCD0451757.1 hypothetical protein [Actinocorallia sp. API 0066]